ncbi:MAG: hypothetical protein ACOVQ2_05665 [Flavobacterium sp.]
MKSNFIFILLFATFLSHSQLDKGNKSFKIGGIMPKNINKKEEKPKAIEPKKSEKPEIPTFEELMKKELSAENPFAKKDKGIIMLPDATIQRRIDDFTPKYAENANTIRPEFLKDQNFGTSTSKTSKISIMCRDHQAIDGDIVDVYLNSYKVASNVYLYSSYKVIEVDLNVGLNKIEIIALNMGEYVPNTADFQVVDGQGNILVSNIWYLATDVKAMMTVIYDGDPK